MCTRHEMRISTEKLYGVSKKNTREIITDWIGVRVGWLYVARIYGGFNRETPLRTSSPSVRHIVEMTANKKLVNTREYDS